jgi:hypothetical protein
MAAQALSSTFRNELRHLVNLPCCTSTGDAWAVA